jgi:hypothetical protein
MPQHQIQTQYQRSNDPDWSLETAQADQITEAILSGKYSWACALLLQFVGHDPMDYIPQRTYSRLIKEHLSRRQAPPQHNQNNSANTIVGNGRFANHMVQDIEYLDMDSPVVQQQLEQIQGGSCPTPYLWLVS